jgi:nucleotide-binding universal stress UspA family protein
MDMVASYALPVPFVDEEATASQVKDAEKYVRDIAATLAPLSVDTRVVVNDHPAAAILALVGETKSDVVAMTTHGRGASRLLVGSVADKVLRATPKPLLLYRPLARIVRKHAGSKRRPARKPRAKATVNT